MKIWKSFECTIAMFGLLVRPHVLVWQLLSLEDIVFSHKLVWNGVVLISQKKLGSKRPHQMSPLNCFSGKSSSDHPMILSSFQHAEPISSGFVSLSPTKGSHPYSSHEFPIESMHCMIAVLYLYTSILPWGKNIYIILILKASSDLFAVKTRGHLIHTSLGGGFKYFLFSKVSNLTNIFQMGWNHQLVVNGTHVAGKKGAFTVTAKDHQATFKTPQDTML